MTILRLLALVGFTWCLMNPVMAAAAPTADDVKALKEKFQKERAEALAAKFPMESLARADELVIRAEESLKEGHFPAAARQYRDARWQLPYLPPGLPEHVARVFGESRLRHANRVNRIVYSPDGTRLASCSKDGTVKIWDLGNGREITTYRGHLDQPDDPTKNGVNQLGVTSVAFHPKEKLMASASGNQVHYWDPETGKYIKTILNLGKTEKPIKPIAFSPDGKSLAVGADDGILRVIEADTGKPIYTSPSRNARIEALAYSPNGKMIVVGDNNSQIAVYAPFQAKEKDPLLMTVQGIDIGEVRDVVFSSDSGAIYAAGRDSKVRLTAGPKPDGSAGGNTATRLREYVGHSGSVNAVAITPDGTQLVTGGEDNSVRVWEVNTAKQLRGFQGHQARYGVTAVAVRGDGKQIASGSDDGAMRIWDLNAVDDHRAFTEATDSLWAVAYSPDGKRIAAAGSDRVIRVYSTVTWKLEATLPGAKSPITTLAFFPDSNRLASAGGDKVVVVWDIEKSKAIRELPGHESAVLVVAVSDDGKRIVSGSADRTLLGFSPESDKAFWTWSGRSAVCAAAIQKGNKMVAVGLADGTLVMLDVSGATPREASTQSAHVAGVACAAFSANGQRLATVGGDGTLRVWTVAEGGALTQLVRFEGRAKVGVSGTPSPLTGVAISPDGRYIATVGADATVRIWDVETKTESRSLRGHTDWVTSVAFSPDGRFVASVGVDNDKTLRVFELPPLDISSAGGHRLAVNSVAVSPDGKMVATASTDQTIRLWDILTGKEVGTLVGNADVPFTITFLDNNSLVMGVSLPTGDTGRLHQWGTNPGRLIRSIPTGEVFTVVANSNGSKVAAWARRPDTMKKHTYEVYDTANGNLLSTATDKGRQVLAVTFSPDLAWAISGDEKGNVSFWDLVNNKQVGNDWPLFTNPFVDIGISPDKKFLVAADDHGLVDVADVEKRNVLGSVTPHKGGVRTILVSPTGKSFVTVSNDREIKAWSLAADDWKQPKPTRTWTLPVGLNGVSFTPDGKQVVTANADGTAYLLDLP